MIQFINTKLYAEIEDLKAELQEAKREIERLNKQLKPRLFWDANNTDISFDCVREVMAHRCDEGAEVGDLVDIQRAVLLPNKSYKFTVLNDENYEFEYEEAKQALKDGDK